MTKRGLLVIDLQNDFCDPKGALPVPGGAEVVPLVVALRDSGSFDLVVYSQDWHPRDHISFASIHPDVPVLSTIEMPQWTQLVVPDHCVQDTWGAQFHPDLGLDDKADALIVRKGFPAETEAYSCFRDILGNPTSLLDLLQRHEITELYLCGVATDVTVVNTVIDAVKLFPPHAVYLIEDAVRGFVPSLVERALVSIKETGARLVSSAALLSSEQFSEHNK